MTTTDHPLRLAVGSHKAGSGLGCAMNVISWENGDAQITDLPECADPMLARVAQRINDKICSHRDGDLLCPDCSVKVLALAHRTVGTRLDRLSDGERRRVYVRLALDEAVSVEHLSTDVRVRACNLALANWLTGTITLDEVRLARDAAANAAYAADAYAASAASAAYAAAYAADADAAYAAANSASAYASAAYASAYAASQSRLDRAHRLIDRFEEYTSVRATPVAPEVTTAAIQRMLVASAL